MQAQAGERLGCEVLWLQLVRNEDIAAEAWATQTANGSETKGGAGAEAEAEAGEVLHAAAGAEEEAGAEDAESQVST